MMRIAPPLGIVMLCAVGAPSCSSESQGAGRRWDGEGPAAWRGMRAHHDLLERVHLADVESGVKFLRRFAVPVV